MSTVSVEAWKSWAPEGEITGKPKLPFFKDMMKRRMSQLSRMVAQVGHDLDEMAPESVEDIVFASRRGEISRQLDITNRLLDEGEVSPSEFGYSVFNAPAALLSLIEEKKGSARALCAGSESFFRGLMQSLLQISSGRSERVLFIYAEEAVPEFYSEIYTGFREPRIVGLLLTRESFVEKPLFQIELKNTGKYEDPDCSFDKFFQWISSAEKTENASSVELTVSSCSLLIKNLQKSAGSRE